MASEGSSGAEGEGPHITALNSDVFELLYMRLQFKIPHTGCVTLSVARSESSDTLAAPLPTSYIGMPSEAGRITVKAIQK